MALFTITTALLAFLNKFVKASFSLCFVLALTTIVLYYIINLFYRYRDINFDKLSYSTYVVYYF